VNEPEEKKAAQKKEYKVLEMGRRQYLRLILLIILVILPKVRLWPAERWNPPHVEGLFSNANPCQSGLEVSDYRRVRICVENLPATSDVVRLTRKKLRTKRELPLKQEGVEPVDGKDGYLSVKVDLVRGVYAMSMAWVRPILLRQMKKWIGNQVQ
jgi:hypothetical protein